MKQPKYLVRPSDCHVFEIDPINNCYRSYYGRGMKNRQHAYKHFTLENLTKHYDFLPITKRQVHPFVKVCDELNCRHPTN